MEKVKSAKSCDRMESVFDSKPEILGVRFVISAVQFWLFSHQFLASNGLLCASLPLFLPNNMKGEEGIRKPEMPFLPLQD